MEPAVLTARQYVAVPLGSSIAVKVLPVNIKPWRTPAPSRYDPTKMLELLMPYTAVLVAPGTVIVLKVRPRIGGWAAAAESISDVTNSNRQRHDRDVLIICSNQDWDSNASGPIQTSAERNYTRMGGSVNRAHLPVRGDQSPAGNLVHPAGFRAAIVLVRVVRRDVVAVLVEADGAVVLAHVNFEFARRPASFPAVVGIARAEITFA